MVKKKLASFSIFIVIILIFLLAFFNFSDTPRFPVKNVPIKIDYSLSRVTEGKRIALTICIRCHYNDSTETLAGRHHGNPKEVGFFFSGNITQDSSTGIGNWSDSELLYFLRTGIKPNGEFVWDMPKYPHLSNEDIHSIIGFLRSDDTLVRATNFMNPKPKYSWIVKVMSWISLRPPKFPDSEIQPPDTADPVVFGRYLATAKFSCFECHSGMSYTVDYENPEHSKSFFAGENLHANEEGEPIYSANLTPDQETGIGTWSEEQFHRALKQGIKPDGTAVKDPMFPFYLLSDKEVDAIYAYLKTIPAIKQNKH